MRSVLFDLDGTLLGLDLGTFLPRYFDALVRYADVHLQIPAFAERLMAGVQAMLAAREVPLTNQEAFAQAFYEDAEEAARAEVVFERFYREVFPSLREHVEPLPGAKEVVALARQRAHKVALATNPLFPRLATEERVRWAGLDPRDFDLITTYENACHSKPDPRYYAEICLRLGIHPETAIMVGNDTLEDGAAKAVGMAFWLVRSPYTIERPSPHPPDRQGSLTEILGWLEEALRGL
jgi:HAD superfamily hydrolase (TIGR01549 family)